ncbi:MAG: LuxR C-terminal-related transcriptional regulator [Gemmatimonadaceae bacterium]
MSLPCEGSPTIIKALRVLLLEDSEADAALIQDELQRSEMPTLLKRVDSEEEFSAALAEFAPDVVLSAHMLSTFDSRAALTILRAERPTTPLIFVTDSLNGQQTVACVRSGAEDVIFKPHLDRLAESIAGAVTVRQPLEKLTPRQIEVLRLVSEGRRTREIASTLGLSVKTVESHRGEVMKRLGMHDVVSLVRFAMRVGLVTAP